MSSRIIKACAFALICASTVSATLQYTLQTDDNYSGANFFDLFDFFTVRFPFVMALCDVKSNTDRALIQLRGMSSIKVKAWPNPTHSEDHWSNTSVAKHTWGWIR